MTPLETLQKYNLKTDVKSIKERLYNPDNYFLELKPSLPNTTDGIVKAMNAVDIVHDADLALLCSLAEKGERRYRPSEHKIEMTLEEAWAQVADEAEPFVIPECIEKVDAALKKGERYEKAVRKHYETAMEDNNVRVEIELEDIIAESEGEPK